jgi:hypothetical protein
MCPTGLKLLAQSDSSLGRLRWRWHAARCASCAAYRGAEQWLDAYAARAGRWEVPTSFRLSLPTTPTSHVGRVKERRPMRRLAYALSFAIVVGLVAGGLTLKPDRPDGRALLMSAAEAMAEVKTIYVRGRATVGAGDDAPWGKIDDGYYEAWYSPAGTRHDSYDAHGNLGHSSVDDVASGVAWSCSPRPSPWFPDGVVTTYRVGTEHLALMTEHARESYLQAELRFAREPEEHPVLSTRTALWNGRRVTVVEQDIGADARGPQGTWEWYLDPSTGRLLGMNRYGPESHGKPLTGSTEVVEYGIDIPSSIFELDPPPGAAVLEDDFEIQGQGCCFDGPASFNSTWKLTPTDSWHVSASGNTWPTKPQFAVDGDPQTRWTARGRYRLQEPGMWFQLDFDTPVGVAKLLVNHGPWGFFGPDEPAEGWPRGLKISATYDGVTWEDVYTGAASPDMSAYGHLGASPEILGLRFELTEYSDEEPWTISEIELYGRPN